MRRRVRRRRSPVLAAVGLQLLLLRLIRLISLVVGLLLLLRDRRGENLWVVGAAA